MNKVKIGGIEMPINIVDMDDSAQYMPDKAIIRVNRDVVSEMQEKRVTHEILHAMMDASGMCAYLDEVGGKEETVVQILEETVHLFLKENTNFFDSV